MIMTNSASIQDVIFFPQMKPEKRDHAATEKDFEAAGIRLELVPIIQKLGIHSIAQLKEIKPAKLFNDVAGMRKKLKLENVQNPTLQEIEGWMK